jgi:hypothetical protein
MFGFVKKSKYEEMEYERDLYMKGYRLEKEDHMKTLRKLSYWLDEYEKLQDSQKRSENNTQFTDSEIRTLISLCHPDKHDQKQSAVTITQKLTSMRKKRGK